MGYKGGREREREMWLRLDVDGWKERAWMQRNGKMERDGVMESQKKYGMKRAVGGKKMRWMVEGELEIDKTEGGREVK